MTRRRPFDPSRVPAGVTRLIPLARRWDIGDEIEPVVAAAPLDELIALCEQVDAVDETVLYGWLSSEEADLALPSPEYVAFSNLALAVDLARVRVRRARPTSPSTPGSP